MFRVTVLSVGLILCVFASNTTIESDIHIIKSDVEMLEVGHIPAECIYTGETSYPPWLDYRDPPWDANVQIQDIYDTDDQMTSMAVDALGRIYVCYQAIYNASPVRYGYGLATSTDNGLTWDNRVYRTGGTTYSEMQPEISITDDGKVYLWGVLNGGAFTNVPCFMRSMIGFYNDPDSLYGFTYFNIPNRVFPECVTRGNGDQLIVAQYTVDRAATANDSVFVIYSEDTVAYYGFGFRPPDGYPEKTTVGSVYDGALDLLFHGVEYYDETNADWDVVCYLDTLQGGLGLHGWSTGNPADDRYPSMLTSQTFAYIAYQGDVGGGDNDIMFNYSTDYGTTWAPSMIDITNDATNETYPRLGGFSTTVLAAYVYGSNQIYSNYSVLNGQDGTWLTTPEIATDGTTANENYHTTSILYTDSYLYCSWEDNRNSGTDGLEIYTSRRTTPIGVEEEKQQLVPFVKFTAVPNPFNKSVAITYVLQHAGIEKNPTVHVYNATGRLVRDLSPITEYSLPAVVIYWDGNDEAGHRVPAGVYFCAVKCGEIHSTNKLILID